MKGIAAKFMQEKSEKNERIYIQIIVNVFRILECQVMISN